MEYTIKVNLKSQTYNDIYHWNIKIIYKFFIIIKNKIINKEAITETN